MNCAVVDDSDLQRLAISKLISDHPQLNLAGQYSNAIETKNGLMETEFDLIFLDIEMPILSGFDLLDALPNKPHIIFVTGKEEYAFKAFNYEAVDYIGKPLTKKRFLTAVDKALNLFKLTNNLESEDEDFIFVKSNLKKRKVILNSLKYIEALGDYVKFVTNTDSFVVLATMKSFEKILPDESFMRVHKSYIANIERIDRYNSREVEIDGEKVPLSRHKKEMLTEKLTQIQ